MFVGGVKRELSKEEKLERREREIGKLCQGKGGMARKRREGKETLVVFTKIQAGHTLGAEIKQCVYNTEVGWGVAGSQLHFFVRIRVRDI